MEDSIYEKYTVKLFKIVDSFLLKYKQGNFEALA